MNPSELMQMSVSDLTTEARLFSSTEKVSKVIGFLRESKSYDALVEEGERTAVVSIRDLIGVSSFEEKLSTLMRYVPRLNPSNNVGDAATLMLEYRSRTMPVYRGGELVGQITSPSIVEKLVDSVTGIKIPSIMTTNPITLSSAMTVSAARELMRRKQIDQLPVLDEGLLSSIVTSEELVFNLEPEVDRNQKGNWQSGRYDEKVGIYAMKDVLTAGKTDSIADVYQSMHDKPANYCLIVNSKIVEGIVTYSDFLKALARKSAGPIVPAYIVGLPEDPLIAEAVRKKFLTAIRLLVKNVRGVEEARAIVKVGETKAPLKRVQVKVLVLTPKERLSYSTARYDYEDAFDDVNNWAKKQATLHGNEPQRRRGSIRKLTGGPDLPR